MSSEYPSIFVTGCGRSGTSLFAGLLNQHDLFQGREPMQADESNPAGYFEDREIERINEKILESSLPSRPRFLGRWLFRNRPNQYAQRWLSYLPEKSELIVPEACRRLIQELTASRPFCFKDPRFSYTLPAWRPAVSNLKYVCMFRNPGAVKHSIRKALAKYPYLGTLNLSDDHIFKVWIRMYDSILQEHSKEGEWLFVHYDQILEHSATERIEDFLGMKIDSSFIQSDLKRSKDDHDFPSIVDSMYAVLCKRAGYTYP